VSDWLVDIDSLPTITLAKLDGTAALQTRVDRKYVVEPRVWKAVVASLSTSLRVLEIDGRRSFRYASTYFDTPGLDGYRDAARKRPRRTKIRIRHYLDTGLRAVEVKTRDARGATVKHRTWLEPCSHPITGPVPLPTEAREFVGSFDATRHTVDQLVAVLTTSYQRVTLSVGNARVTVDRDVSAVDTHGNRLPYGDLLIVESKSLAGAGAVDRALWALGVRPTRISKYCTSLAALHPHLPSHRWSRTLRRHINQPTAPSAAA
jgi:hypothetical protein